MRKKQDNQHRLGARCVMAVLFLCLTANFAMGQEISSSNAKVNRERGLVILSRIKEVIKREYYDPKYHGLDLDKHDN